MPTTLLIARHGEAEYEIVDLLSSEGGSLTTLGRAQAARLATRAADAGVSHVWTSTLARAVQTGEIVAAQLGVSVTTRTGLREFEIGDLAGLPVEPDPCAVYFARWLSGDLDLEVPGGESGTTVLARLRTTLTEIVDAHPDETVLVVSHGGVIRFGLPLLTRMQVEPGSVANCAVATVSAGPAGWVCTGWDSPA